MFNIDSNASNTLISFSDIAFYKMIWSMVPNNGHFTTLSLFLNGLIHI